MARVSGLAIGVLSDHIANPIHRYSLQGLAIRREPGHILWSDRGGYGAQRTVSIAVRGAGAAAVRAVQGRRRILEGARDYTYCASTRG